LGGLVATLVMTLSALPVQAAKLKKGDIVVADVGAKAIIQVFKSLAGLDTDAKGNILVADYAAATIFRVNPKTGKQTIASSGGSFVSPTDLRVYRGTKGRHEGSRQYDSEADYEN